MGEVVELEVERFNAYLKQESGHPAQYAESIYYSLREAYKEDNLTKELLRRRHVVDMHHRQSIHKFFTLEDLTE